LFKRGAGPYIVALFECDDEILAQAEIFWIRYFSGIGFRLTNLTEGGEGASGYRHSPETRKRMSELKKGIKLRPEAVQGRRKLTPSQEKEIVDMYLKGASCDDISRQRGDISSGGARKILIRHGISMRVPWAIGPKRGPAPKFLPSPEQEKTIFDMHSSGKNAREISEALKITLTCKVVSRIVKAALRKMVTDENATEKQ